MIDDSKENIPNTFAPYCNNKMLSLRMIILGLKTSAFHFDQLPSDVQKRVNDYIVRHYEKIEWR